MNNALNYLGEIYDGVYKNEPGGFRGLNLERWPRNRWEALVRVFPKKVKRVLEIGCGNGIVLHTIAPNCESLYGTEISNNRRLIAKANLNHLNKPIEISGENIEFGINKPDGYFDVIIWADVIAHVVDVFRAMEEIVRLLASGGTLITSTPNMAYLPYRLKLLFGIFPGNSGGSEGMDVRLGEMYDGGILHYFTISSLKKMYRKYNIKPTKTLGFGSYGVLHQIKPSLLSGAALLVGQKEAK